MNRFIPVVVIVIALVVAFLISRPKPVANAIVSNFSVQARTLTGKAIAPQAVDHLRVALLIAGTSVAESAVTNGQYSLELPSEIKLPPISLKNVQLVHGDGRLPESALGADAKLLMYEDQNKNAVLDSGEPQLEATLFTPNTDLNLRAFFRYKLLLLNADVRFIETQDSATGAKGYYRYNLPATAGWNILEGELASNGYDVRLRSDNKWDILAALPAGGKATPPVFTPQ
jgi:hypothetical protein